MKLIKGKVKSEVTGSNTSGAPAATAPTNAQLIGGVDNLGKLQALLTARADGQDRTAVLAVVPGHIDGSGNVTMARGAVAAPDGTLLVGAQGIYALNASNTWDKLRSVNTGQLVVTPKGSAGSEVIGAPGAAVPAGAVYMAAANGSGNLTGLLVDAQRTLLTRLMDASGNNATTIVASASDARTSGSVLDTGARNMLFNGASHDQQRNNTEGTLLASAARTADGPSANQTNYNGVGVTVTLDVTAKAGATTLTVNLQEIEPVTAGAKTIAQSAAFAATAGQKYVVVFAPGILAADYASGVSAKNIRLPRTWRVVVVPSDADSVTYSAGQATHL